MDGTERRGVVEAGTGLKEVLARVPDADALLLQHGRLFRARPGELSLDYPGLTTAGYAALNGTALAPLLRLLNAAVEASYERGPTRGERPGGNGPRPRPVMRGISSGYTGACREPTDLDLEDVVSVQLARGPE